MTTIAAQTHFKLEGVKLRLELDTYMVLDGRRSLEGKLTVECIDLPEGRPDGVEIRLSVAENSGGKTLWLDRISAALGAGSQAHPILLPVGEWSGGYYRLEAALYQDGSPIDPAPGLNDRRGVLLAVRRVTPRAVAPATSRNTDLLQFAIRTVDQLLAHQSARAGGRDDGTVCITISDRVYRSYRSLGAKKDGAFQLYWFPEAPFELHPTRLDTELWPVLDRLSRTSGDVRYADTVTAMAQAVAPHWFDERSGLGYMGEEADLNVVTLQPLGKAGAAPRFKPRNSGCFADLPLERLWAHAPAQTTRMFRAMFYGLVTDAASMDFNRFTSYGFADADRKHSQSRNASHCAFESIASRMIHWWCSTYSHTGDMECLGWAQRMADKWRAVQHPESGLVPNFFGTTASAAPEMLPGQWAQTRGGAVASSGLMDAALELRRRKPGTELELQLTRMAVRLARGTARYGYDSRRRAFYETLRLDGTPMLETARYTFRTQEEKDAELRHNPLMAQVPVYNGYGFYEPGGYWEHCAGMPTTGFLMKVAEQSGDRELLALVTPMAEHAIEASAGLQSAFTPAGRWTFRATAVHIQMLLSLLRITGERRYLAAAHAMASDEINRLEAIECPDWWRMPDRSALIGAMVDLHAASQSIATTELAHGSA